MSAKSAVLVVAGLGLLSAPVALFLLLPRKAKSDGVALVAPDAVLGDSVAPTVSATKPELLPARPETKLSSWEEIIRVCEPSVAVVKGKVGHGTGFLLPNGVLATNAHVINLEFEENLRVHFPSAPKSQQGPYKAQFIWADRRRDLAFLYVDCSVPCVDLAEEYNFRKGQEVLAIGNPGIGQGELLPNAVSRGLMSTITKLDKQPFYQLDIAVNPGNSGGPVIDKDGKVLGMITAKIRGKDGIAFAIPLTDLNNGYLEVVGQGRETTPELMAWHRGCTVLERLIHIGDLYLGALDANSKAMDAAVAKGQSPNDGLRNISPEIRKDVKTIDKIFADNLEQNYQLTVRENHLYPEDIQRVRQLWAVCQDMKRMYDNPSGTVDAYRNRKNQLRQQFERLLGAEEQSAKKPPKKR